MEINTFRPSGNTVTFTANTSAPTGVQAAATATPRPYDLSQYRIHNDSASTVFLAYGTTAALAQSAAIIPTGTARASYPLAAGHTEVFTAPPDAFWSGITSSGSGAVYITPGQGL